MGSCLQSLFRGPFPLAPLSRGLGKASAYHRRSQETIRAGEKRFGF
uniref:Uncharacterized protein n=1 Tax=Anguilla anguilla TaxID=7936 RepID=A0A0E9VX66_ANGAN